MKSKLISISAISAGFIALFLTVGAYFEFLDIFMVVATSVFVIMPLYYKSFKACFLTYLAGGVLAFLLSGFNIFTIVFPAYFGFFGIYPIIRFIFDKNNTNKLIVCLIGLIWCALAIFGIYFFYVNIMPDFFKGVPEFIIKYIYVFLALFSVLIYFLFDRTLIAVRKVSDRYLYRFFK